MVEDGKQDGGALAEAFGGGKVAETWLEEGSSLTVRTTHKSKFTLADLALLVRTAEDAGFRPDSAVDIWAPGLSGIQITVKRGKRLARLDGDEQEPT